MSARIHEGNYVQGDINFAVGAGLKETFDIVGALPLSTKKALAQANNISTDGATNSDLGAILKSHVQNVWVASTKGTLPEELVKAHAARLQRHTLTCELAGTREGDLLASGLRKRKTSATRVQLLYVLDAAAYEQKWKDHRSQQALVVRAIQELGNPTTGVTIRQIADTVKETKETTAPTANTAIPVIKKLIEAGIVTCLNPEAAVVRKKKDPKAEPVTSVKTNNKPTPTNKPVSKKH